MKIQIDGKVDPRFREDYEALMMSKGGADDLPNPHPKMLTNGIFHNYRPWEYYQVMKYGDFRTSDIVLDTGAMHTYFSIYLMQFVKQIFVTDNFYWATRDYMKNEKLFPPDKWMAYVEGKGGGKIKAEEQDIMNLQYPEETFDKVLCISTIEHVKDDAKGIKELTRVLKTDGKLLVTTEFNSHTPKPFAEEDGSYYRVYTPKLLEELVRHSSLTLEDVLAEKRTFFFNHRKHVNIFLCLQK